MSQEPFMQTEQMSCVYHGRTKDECCDHVKSIQASSPLPLPLLVIFTDRSKVVLLLWFTISVIVLSLHVCPGESFILDSRSVSIWERNI